MPFLVQHLLHKIKVQQFYTDLGIYQQCLVLQKIVEIEDFSRLWVIFQYFSRQISFSRTFQERPLNSSTFQACANPDLVCKKVAGQIEELSDGLSFTKMTFLLKPYDQIQPYLSSDLLTIIVGCAIAHLFWPHPKGVCRGLCYHYFRDSLAVNLIEQ